MDNHDRAVPSSIVDDGFSPLTANNGSNIYAQVTSDRNSSKRASRASRQFDEDFNRTYQLPYAEEASGMAQTFSHRNAHPDVSQKQLPALQTYDNLEHLDTFEPLNEDDPSNYDLIAPQDNEVQSQPQRSEYSLEKRSQALFSRDHLQVIFADSALLLKFTSFLGLHRPQSVPILIHYLDCLKAIRAIHYTNAICDGLDPVEGLDFTQDSVRPTVNAALEARANAAFDVLARDELPAYIAHLYIQIVSNTITARVTGSLSADLREASEGLAEVFCLTDPSRPDNPIVFASDEFNRMTQYGMNYILGRNCRFLQGPWTNPYSVKRLRDAIKANREHQEVFLNYRRDGSPFMNLLMLAPLVDGRGKTRYHIGAQVDVSGLVKECAELESLQRLLELQARGETAPDLHKPSPEKNDELRELSEMLNQGEIDTIRKWGGRMHKEGVVEEDSESVSGHVHAPRLLLKDPQAMTPPIGGPSGKLSGIYQNYLLVRPYPSLRILFASPSQRISGVLQSPFMSRIGGSNRVREELTAAFAEGRGVTAKVRWMSKGDEEGRNKWIHCTPLLGLTGQLGVWMVIIIDDDKDKGWMRQAQAMQQSHMSIMQSNTATQRAPSPVTNGHGHGHTRNGSRNGFAGPRVNDDSGYGDGEGSNGSGSIASLRLY